MQAFGLVVFGLVGGFLAGYGAELRAELLPIGGFAAAVYLASALVEGRFDLRSER